MINYSKDPMDRIADAVEKLAGGSSPDEPTTIGVEIYGGYIGVHNSSIGIGFLLKFEQEMHPEYSDFVVPMFVPGSEDTEDVHGLGGVAFFKKVDDATGDVSYVTFFYVDQNNPRVNADGDIVIEANVLYNNCVFLEVSKIPEDDEVSIQILPKIG